MESKGAYSCSLSKDSLNYSPSLFKGQYASCSLTHILKLNGGYLDFSHPTELKVYISLKFI